MLGRKTFIASIHHQKMQIKPVRWALILFFLLLFIAGNQPAIHAQNPFSTPNYWQRDVAAPIEQFVIIDLENDGFQEFAIVSSDATIDLVRGDSTLVWDESFRAPAPILALTALVSASAEEENELTAKVQQLGIATTREILVINQAKETVWSTPVTAGMRPTNVHALPINASGEEALLVQFADGELQVYDRNGQLAWRYQPEGDVAVDSGSSTIIVENIDGDAQVDILYGFGRITQYAGAQITTGLVVRIDSSSGEPIWEYETEGTVSALTAAPFDSEAPYSIAVGDTAGKLQLLSVTGSALWRNERTLNRPIASLITTNWSTLNRILIASTDVGKLIAYSASGERLWDKIICEDSEDGRVSINDVRCNLGAVGQIVELSAPPLNAPNRQPLALSILVADSFDSAEILLIDSEFNTLGQYPAGITPNNPKLVDVNNDGVQELLLTNFTTLELIGTSTSARTPLDNWGGYLLRRGQSNVMLAADLDGDSAEELLVGAADRLHVLRFDGELVWLRPIPGTVSFLEVIAPPPFSQDVGLSNVAAPLGPQILVGYYASDPTTGGIDTSFLMLYRADSSAVWDSPIEIKGKLSALYLDTSDPTRPLVVYGTESSQLRALALSPSATNADSWDTKFIWDEIELFGRTVTDISAFTLGDSQRIAASTRDEVMIFNREQGQNIGYFGINTDESESGCQTGTDVLYLLKTGIAHGLVCGGATIRSLTNALADCPACWQTQVGEPAAYFQTRTQHFDYSPLSKTRWQRTERFTADNLQSRNTVLSQDENSEQLIENVQRYITGSFSSESIPNIVLLADGKLWLDLNTDAIRALGLGFNVVDAVALKPANNAPAGLAVSADNGRIYLYQFQPNYPPLLTHPSVNRSAETYTIQTSLFDVERSKIDVELEVFNPTLDEWQSKGIRNNSTGANLLTWQLDNLANDQPVEYRFRYSEAAGAQAGVIGHTGPRPVTPTLWYIWVALAFSTLIMTVVGWQGLRWFKRQSNTLTKRAYKTISAEPTKTLDQIRRFYNRTTSTNDQLLTLANELRNDGNVALADLTDGLYLLANQPHAGLPIINKTIVALHEDKATQQWHGLSNWVTVFGSTQTFVESPTVSELALQAPLLDEIAAVGSRSEDDFTPLEALRPIMESLGYSEQVDSTDDRLTYLSDANALLRRLHGTLRTSKPTLNTRLTMAVVSRWMGLVSAEIEALRGRARLQIELRTLQVLPSAETLIILDLTNTGRAPAEEITIALQDGSVKPVRSPLQAIPYLEAGRSRAITYHLNLLELTEKQFRLAFSVEYGDRAQTNLTLEYANIISVLQTDAAFVPIMNPYSPGTPLRQNSQLFFGRTDLFDFIASEAKRLAQKHVLILVGQRRTGKTSALLRLGQHLPAQILPVYVDCQSLGVIPGMSAFFQDIAWQIADAIESRGIEFELPDMAEASENPGNWFQRVMLPAAKQVLSAETQLLLVFDEFEALENLVDDGILPNTIFPYMRHLMQHSVGLSFIFVGTRRLEALSTSYWSVLFNIALYKEIDFLSKPAARQLMTEPTAPHLQYDDLAIDKVWRITAGHPYFLQLVCYSMVKRANTLRQGYITISDVNASIEEMLQLGEVHFAYIWQRSTFAERAILIAVAHLLDTELPFAPAELLHALVPFGIELTPANATRALNSLVERNIMRAIHDGGTTIYALKIGLVGTWIEHTKSITRLYSDQPSV